MDSILTLTKKLLGIEEDYTHFDTDIIVHINSAFMSLNQLGVGPAEGFLIKDNTALWSDYLGVDSKKLEGVKTYIYSKVRLIFDPPATAAVLEAMERQIQELEWRLNIEMEGVDDSAG